MRGELINQHYWEYSVKHSGLIGLPNKSKQSVGCPASISDRQHPLMTLPAKRTKSEWEGSKSRVASNPAFYWLQGLRLIVAHLSR